MKDAEWVASNKLKYLLNVTLKEVLVLRGRIGSYSSTCWSMKRHLIFISQAQYTPISKQVTIYIDDAYFGARIDFLHGFVGNTYHILGTQQSQWT